LILFIYHIDLAAVIYRISGHPKALYYVMHRGIQPYDTIETVQQQLGVGRIIKTGERHEEYLTVTRKFAEDSPSHWPDGVKDQDVFHQYPLGTRTCLSCINLQFRQGILVNYHPDDFAEYTGLGDFVGSPALR
jgi:hypothetical protein